MALALRVIKFNCVTKGKEKMKTNPLIEYDNKIFSAIAVARYTEALWVANEELHLAYERFGTANSETSKVLNNLGWIHDLMGHAKEAEENYLKALEIKVQDQNAHSADVIPTLENLVTLYISQKENEKAKTFLNKLIDVVETLNDPYKMRKSVYLCNLAEIEESEGAFNRAEWYYQQAIGFLEANYPYDHPNIGRTFGKLGALFQKLDDFQKSEFYYSRSLRILKKHLSPNHPDVQFTLQGLKEIYAAVGIKKRVS